MQTLQKEEFKKMLLENIKTLSRKTIENANTEEIYEAVVFTLRDIVTDKWIATHQEYGDKDCKLLYYLSMEFLMGRFLGNAVLNLSLEGPIKEALEELGLDYNQIEEAEADPGLGNGGLGRLAACFLDSLSTMGYAAYGAGIRYHFGLFEQTIEDGYQKEVPDNWMKDGDPWCVRRDEYSVEIKFGGRVNAIKDENNFYHFVLENYQSVMAVPYDYPIVGYKPGIINTLRLWDAEAVNRFNDPYNDTNYERANQEQRLARKLTEVLYPADEKIEGKELRLKQQYFFISATLQRALARFSKMHEDFNQLPDYIQLQLNDTHPTLAVAELMRIMMDVYFVPWDDAWDITRRVCSYTNHTIMSEALEKWPIELFSRLLPRIYMIVEEINRRFCVNLVEWYGNDPNKIRKMAIVADGMVRMAYLAIVGSHSVNGVAQMHTNILKEKELHDFYEIYPEKFNNKTNGITQRRWLAKCNPRLSALITENIGDKWITDLSELKKIKPLAKDSAFREKFMDIKRANKVSLSNYLKETMNESIDPDSIFDIQVKRLHEYKRQLLNIFHVIDIYNTIKLNPNMEMQPRTFLFSAKAAASYEMAKLIIKLINSVAALVNGDNATKDRIKVLFIPNYRVSLAERLIPAADVSEQISTAGKEASGTGNMKFMLNGAVTIGTLDGANVEILEEVGPENIFIFGMTDKEVQTLKESGAYSPWNLYNMDFNIRYVLTTLINGTLDYMNHDLFRKIYDSMLNGVGSSRPDRYFVLQDFQAYKAAQAKLDTAYKDRERWAEMAVNNTASAGKFSSDRTIRQYADEVWNIKPIFTTE